MRIIIFLDKDNFDKSLNWVNKDYPKGQKRFWDISKYIPFLLEKIKDLDKEKFNKEELKLIKTFIYTGRYNSEIIYKIKWTCNNKIKEIKQAVDIENLLLEELTRLCSAKCNLKEEKINEKIVEYVKRNILALEEKKKIYEDRIAKQVRNRDGQKKFFSWISKNPFIELKTTLIKYADGEVYQKGVDNKLVTDLIHLAHTDSYDIALILSGDSDLAEAVKLVKENLSKTVIVVSYYTEGDCLLSNISDLKKVVGNNFLNLKDFTKEELEKMSDLRRIKETEQ
jgi:uncharacterized LabA/DUF88 family protein